MNIDGIGFNQAWAKKKSEDDFVLEFIGMDHIWPELSADEKEAALRSAHKQLNAPEPEKEAAE